MAKSKKKNRSAAKSAVRKPRPARKLQARNAKPKNPASEKKIAPRLISQEQDALYEIDEALKRVEIGTYGKCEMSGKPIPRARLEAIPFARFTVECQSQLEKQSKATRMRPSVTSLFGLTEEEGAESEEEEATPSEVKE